MPDSLAGATGCQGRHAQRLLRQAIAPSGPFHASAQGGRKMARAEDVVGCRVKLSLNSVVGVGWGETAWKSGMAAVGWGGKAVWQ